MVLCRGQLDSSLNELSFGFMNSLRSCLFSPSLLFHFGFINSFWVGSSFFFNFNLINSLGEGIMGSFVTLPGKSNLVNSAGL